MAIVLQKSVSLDSPIKVEPLYGMIFTYEQGAHVFKIACSQFGEGIELTGSISAKFLRADRNTIALVGSIDEEGRAVVTLSQDCYNVGGRFQLTIFNTVGDTTFCVYACVGTAQKSADGNLIDGGEIIDTIDDLIADIQTAVASIPPDYSALVARVDAIDNPALVVTHDGNGNVTLTFRTGVE